MPFPLAEGQGEGGQTVLAGSEVRRVEWDSPAGESGRMQRTADVGPVDERAGGDGLPSVDADCY